MLIPLAYVPAILQAVNSPGGLSPQGLWDVIIDSLRVTAGCEAACQSFVNWARVTVSHGASATNPLQLPAFPVVPLSALLAKARAYIIYQDLPHRFASNDMSTIVAELGAFRADTTAQALAQEAREVVRTSEGTFMKTNVPHTKISVVHPKSHMSTQNSMLSRIIAYNSK